MARASVRRTSWGYPQVFGDSRVSLESDVSRRETDGFGVAHCCRNSLSALFRTQETLGEGRGVALFPGLEQMHAMRVFHFVICGFFSLLREFQDFSRICRKHSCPNGGLICGKNMA